jgi:phage shock protein A
MKAMELCLGASLILIGTLAPVRTLGQSQNSTDEIRELRKLVEELRAQMSEMKTELDLLKGTKPEASAQSATAHAGSSTPQEGTIEAAQLRRRAHYPLKLAKPQRSVKNLMRTLSQPRG